MSDLLFNETPVVGKKYKFGDWKLYAKHNDKEIRGFFGEYRWLSNFENCDVWFEGCRFLSSEAAYQAAKVAPEHRQALGLLSPVESKKQWKNYPLLDKKGADWDARKNDVMSIVLMDKFYRNLDLRQKLIDTGNRYLEETNHWKDTWFGYDINIGGDNHLGKILMKVREFWK